MWKKNLLNLNGPKMCFVFFKKNIAFFIYLLVKYDWDMILTAFTRFSWTGLGSAAHFSLQFCLHSRCQCDSRDGPRKKGFLFLHWIQQSNLFSGWCFWLIALTTWKGGQWKIEVLKKKKKVLILFSYLITIYFFVKNLLRPDHYGFILDFLLFIYHWTFEILGDV